MRGAAIGLCLWLTCAGAVASAQPGEDEPATPPGDEAPAAAPPGDEDQAPAATQQKQRVAGAGYRQTGESAYGNIYVVPRRSVLKRHRLELLPTYNVTINNAVVRHHGFGAMLNLYLSEALFVGVEGTYYAKQLTNDYFLLGLDERVVPSVNRYVFSAFLDLGYVPISGKFTLLNSGIGHYEVWVALGVGLFQTQVIPRNPADQAFTNNDVGALVGVGARLWLSRWFAFDAYLKNYVFGDKLENTMRPSGQSASDAQADAQSAFTLDITFGVGFSIMLPPGFEYHNPR